MSQAETTVSEPTVPSVTGEGMAEALGEEAEAYASASASRTAACRAILGCIEGILQAAGLDAQTWITQTAAGERMLLQVRAGSRLTLDFASSFTLRDAGGAVLDSAGGEPAGGERRE